MPVQLPPLRSLPDPDRMLHEILTATADGDPAAPPRRQTRVARAVLIAAAAVAVTAVAVPVVLQQRRDTITAVPSPSAVAPTLPGPPAASPTPRHPTTGHLALGTTATLDQVNVTVSEVSHSPSFGILIKAEVCVRALPHAASATRVSWAPWTILDTQGTTTASLRQGPPGIDEPRNLFPREQLLHVGQCTSGWIPFDADEHGSVAAVLYADGLGGTAAWAGE